MVFLLTTQLNLSRVVSCIANYTDRQLPRVRCCRAIMKKADDNNGQLRHIRYREKIGGKLPVPGTIELVVVGSGHNGTPQGLVVNTSHVKYLFNCGEGTQRIATEHKMKLSRIEHVFITQSSWKNIGGLMGLCLTLETANVPHVTLHGPPLAEQHVTSARSFAQLRSLQLVKREISAGEFIDTAMCVESIPIFPAVMEPSSDLTASDKSMAKKRRLSASSAEEEVVVVFVCKPHPKPRALSLEKCVDHNVPAGPLMGQLKDGQEVTLSNGQLVRPDDVLEPAEPSDPFIIVECPSMAFINSLTSNKALSKYQQSTDQPTDQPVKVAIVVHFTPDSVFTSHEYQSWMARFGETTCHLVLNDLGSDLALEAVHVIQAKLNLVHSGIFPILPSQPSQPVKLDTDRLVFGRTNLKYIYRGRNAATFSHEHCLTLNHEQHTKEILAQTEFTEALSHLQQRIKDSPPTDGESYPEMLFLGTGSAMPNKVRNVSAIWLNLSESVSMLLDCGENTLGQLYRHYGPMNTADALRRLHTVYVSHLHADHHLGIIGLAMERHRLIQLSGIGTFKPLIVIAAQPLAEWYKTLDNKLIPINSLVRVIPIGTLYKTQQDEHCSELTHSLGLSQISVVRVHHRQHPHGIMLEHKDGWKLAYSGDTMPCPEFIQLGQGCNVVIHEATMEDDLAEDAKDKRHSTTSQAIDVGVQMNAQFIILTHFSQRYAKVPIFTGDFNGRVGIAFDNMRVRPCDLPLLPLFTPALKAMFAEDYADMEEKSDRKRRQKRGLLK